MTAITEAQRVALEKAVEALYDKADVADTDEESDYYDEAYCIIRDLVDNATIEATPLWRDRPREDWMLDGEIHLELADAPYITVERSRGLSVLIDDDSGAVSVLPWRLPALIATLQEMQRRIGGDK